MYYRILLRRAHVKEKRRCFVYVYVCMCVCVCVYVCDIVRNNKTVKKHSF